MSFSTNGELNGSVFNAIICSNRLIRELLSVQLSAAIIKKS